jgi:hypothetical protein
MADTNDVLIASLQIAGEIASLLPAMAALYEKIRDNNQNAGLVPASQLIADGISAAKATEQAAQSEIDSSL